jgi:hypothetical protein
VGESPTLHGISEMTTINILKSQTQRSWEKIQREAKRIVPIKITVLFLAEKGNEETCRSY